MGKDMNGHGYRSKVRSESFHLGVFVFLYVFMKLFSWRRSEIVEGRSPGLESEVCYHC